MATSPSAAAIANATVTARSRASRTRRTTGRAIAIRSRKSPTAAITSRKTTVRAATRRGVAAVSEIFGTTNCGCGPGFGPTANVNALWTGCPSAEIARQKTRYHPSGSFFSGTTSVFGSVSERLGLSVVCWRPAASVTEMMANRGSTASENVSRTRRGGVLTVPLAEGDSRTSAA